jgi:hypothetical protein
MRKYDLLILLILNGSIAFSQSKPPKLISVSSAPRQINTFPFFETPPEPTKEVAVVVPDVKKSAKKPPEKEKNVKKAPVPVKEAISERKQETATTEAPAPATEAEGFKIIYFDKQNRKPGSKTNAYFYRRVKFDQSSNKPIGTVTDFYASTNKPKFVGQYRKYEDLYEEKNRDFEGRCLFYEENGAYSIRNYSNRHLLNETRYNEKGQVTAQIEYTSDGKRKRFSEYTADKNGRKLRNLEGSYNSKTGKEEAREETFYESEKLKSTKDFIDDCPKPKGTFYKENGEKYDAYFQDFTCNPLYSQGWKFANGSSFQTSHKKEARKYEIRAEQGKQAGIFHLPVSYDFYNNAYEIAAVFDLSGSRPMQEVGIVWEFQDSQNYAYLKVNLTTKTFEINSVKDGVTQKYMAGIKPQPFTVTDSNVKIVFRKTAHERVFILNDEPLKYQKSSGQQVNYDKFVRVNLEKDFKTWGVGFYFKSAVINESIILKSLEVKLM